jgi:hypothetical protein
MQVKRLLVDVFTVFSISLVVSVIVTWLWNLVVHKAGSIDWETSLRFAIVLGITLPWIATPRTKAR